MEMFEGMSNEELRLNLELSRQELENWKTEYERICSTINELESRINFLRKNLEGVSWQTHYLQKRIEYLEADIKKNN